MVGTLPASRRSAPAINRLPRRLSSRVNYRGAAVAPRPGAGCQSSTARVDRYAGAPRSVAKALPAIVVVVLRRPRTAKAVAPVTVDAQSLEMTAIGSAQWSPRTTPAFRGRHRLRRAAPKDTR